ncbi:MULTISPECIES: hypothetical protein [Moorena]|uniref:hypothetical protein n=1 Tax=Moorena TaxID=1155738 RepID=UPI00030F7A40|nr:MULTISPECIES: hypothetical protein [Moorena]NEP36383.1 hypothetical protein [Moorena sp. SIO3B2]NEP68141.1 hypothetical protein [Moorena sp. SIO3A5]NEQ10580.1 hypothetical protein [Moorena sp. SIO4E2]NEQ17724.1 hypothetical protein [Moorena sp. SIO3E2]
MVVGSVGIVGDVGGNGSIGWLQVEFPELSPVSDWIPSGGDQKQLWNENQS